MAKACLRLLGRKLAIRGANRSPCTTTAACSSASTVSAPGGRSCPDPFGGFPLVMFLPLLCFFVSESTHLVPLWLLLFVPSFFSLSAVKRRTFYGLKLELLTCGTCQLFLILPRCSGSLPASRRFGRVDPARASGSGAGRGGLRTKGSDAAGRLRLRRAVGCLGHRRRARSEPCAPHGDAAVVMFL